MTDKNYRDAEVCCTGPDPAKGSGGAESVTMPPPVASSSARNFRIKRIIGGRGGLA